MLILLSCNHISTPFAFLLATFLLTHPLRGATNGYLGISSWAFISTHTPLAGCNRCQGLGFILEKNFYSHTPCGVQHVPVMLIIMILNFYSHTPCGVQRCSFSNKYHIEYFYSHTPCGVQHNVKNYIHIIRKFLLTHPLRGATTGCV